MIISTLVEQAVGPLLRGMAALADTKPSPTESPSPIPTATLDTGGVMNFIIGRIVPILIAAIGVLFISRAHKGEMSKVLTSSAIVVIGIVFIVGAGLLFAFGNGLVNIFFKSDN